MTPQDSQVLNDTTGDCFSACVASMLDLPLADVPNFMEHPGPLWWTAVQEWLTARRLTIEVHRVKDYNPLGHWIGSGKSPRGDYSHACIFHGNTLAHDPHPSRAGLVGPPEFCYVLIPLREAA